MQAVYFGWLESPVDIADELELPQFTLIGTLLNDCSTNYTTGRVNYSLDNANVSRIRALLCPDP